MVDFNAILNKKVSDVEAPAQFPQGSYELLISKLEYGVSAKKQTPQLTAIMRVIAPREDVDPEQYAKIKNPSERDIKTTMYLTEDSLFRVKDFCAKAGVDMSNPDLNLSDAVAQLQDRSIVGVASTELVDDKEFTRWDKFFPING